LFGLLIRILINLLISLLLFLLGLLIFLHFGSISRGGLLGSLVGRVFVAESSPLVFIAFFGGFQN
jgi:hypothetical protein